MNDAPQTPTPEGALPDEETVVVFRSWSDVEAELVAGLLRASDIPCTLVSDVPHSVYPLTLDGLGEVRLVVARNQAEAARACIAAHRSADEGGAPPPEPLDEG